MKPSLSPLSFSAAALVVTLLTATPARAETEFAWCAVSSTLGLGQPLCHFTTLEQCSAFLNGLGGSCRPNARVTVPVQKSRAGARS